MKEIKFKGPAQKEIAMQKFGLSEGLLNRHIGSEALRTRLQGREEN